MESKLEKPILPQLKALVWSSNTAQLDGYIKLFAGTQLTSLSIDYNPRTLGLSEAQGIGSIGHYAPNLTSICVHWCGWDTQQAVANTVTAIICGLKQITDVSCRGVQLNPQAIRHLATSSCACLNIGNDAIDILRSIRRMAPTPAFPELQKLIVCSNDMTSLSQLIELLRADTLRRIHIFYRTQVPEMETNIEQLIGTLGARCSHADLTEVWIHDEKTN
jgi:hypothetical protein